MSHLEEAQTDFDKKDKRFKVAVGALIAYVVIMLSFLAVQTYIADALLVPVADREAGAFDSCGVEARRSVENAGGSEDTSFLEQQRNSSGSSTSPVASTSQPSNVPPQTPQEPVAEPPVVTAPPDPDAPLLVVPLPLLHLRIGDILQVGN